MNQLLEEEAEALQELLILIDALKWAAQTSGLPQANIDWRHKQFGIVIDSKILIFESALQKALNGDSNDIP